MAAQLKSDFEAIFDVSPMFSTSHIPSATNAKASAGGTDLSDSPAMAGAQLMEDAGFKKVFRLEGNFGAWVDAGYDVE